MKMWQPKWMWYSWFMLRWLNLFPDTPRDWLEVGDGEMGILKDGGVVCPPKQHK
jgi:hypothetical protein